MYTNTPSMHTHSVELCLRWVLHINITYHLHTTDKYNTPKLRQDYHGRSPEQEKVDRIYNKVLTGPIYIMYRLLLGWQPQHPHRCMDIGLSYCYRWVHGWFTSNDLDQNGPWVV